MVPRAILVAMGTVEAEHGLMLSWAALGFAITASAYLLAPFLALYILPARMYAHLLRGSGLNQAWRLGKKLHYSGGSSSTTATTTTTTTTTTSALLTTPAAAAAGVTYFQQHCMGLVANVMIGTLAFQGLSEVLHNSGFLLGSGAPSNPTLDRAMGFTLGYFVSDMLHMFVRREASLAGSGKALRSQMIAHHVLGGTFLPYNLVARCGVLPTAWLLATELTSAPMNVRALLRDVGGADTVPGWLRAVVDVAFVICYMVMRVAPLPLFLHRVGLGALGLSTDEPPLPAVHRLILLAGLIVIPSLFLFWAHLILRGILNAVRGGGDTSGRYVRDGDEKSIKVPRRQSARLGAKKVV